MDTRIAPGGSRLDVVPTDTAPRVSPPPKGHPFASFVARGAGSLVRGAEAAISSLPGAPIVAAAVRGGQGASIGSAGFTRPRCRAAPAGAAALRRARAFAIARGRDLRLPWRASDRPRVRFPQALRALARRAETGSVEQALAQSQDFNLYYLQLQEQLSAENRAYSAMSNVLKTRHDTVKNAIGNIR